MSESESDVRAAWERTLAVRQAILGYEEAARLPEVVAFRRKHFPNGKLLSGSDRVVRRWLNSLVSESGGEVLGLDLPTVSWEEAAEILKDTRPEPDRPRAPSRNEALLVAQTKTDTFRKWVHRRTVAGELAELSLKLSLEFGWTSSSVARWLIVRDARPEAENASLQLGKPECSPHEGGPPYWSMAVNLTVPIDYPPSRLAREFAALQEAIGESFAFRVPASKPASAIALERCLRAVALNDGEHTWRQVVEAWNAEHPEDAFELDREGIHLFAKSVRQTYKAVMAPRTFEWKGSRG